MEFSIARQRFYQEVRQPIDRINLAKAALYIAQEDYPQLEVDAYLNALDTMAMELQERLPVDPYPLRMIQAINQYLYDDLGFRGNSQDYYDPRNSFLNEVIDRRTGIPITLSLIYLELVQRLDFPMVGVGLPGHFLIRPTLPDLEIFVDPFNQGEVLFVEDCQERLQELYGASAQLRPEFLQAITADRFLMRLLSNLKIIYVNRSDLPRALGAIDRILLISPDAVHEQRDRGLVRYQLGHWAEAARDLQGYLMALPSAPDAIAIQQLLDRINKSE